MYQIKTDCHVHTIFSGHAYSTVEECAVYAAKQNMEGIVITDHFCPIREEEYGEKIVPIINLTVLPPYIQGVRIMRGMEADILDLDGHLANYNIMHEGKSVLETAWKDSELVIASVHRGPGKMETDRNDVSGNTEMYIKVLQNQKVNVLGHVGRSGYKFDMLPVIREAGRLGKALEINEASSRFGTQIPSICRRVAELCAQEKTMIMVNSDAHSAHSIGIYQESIRMLEEIHFPEELIANRTLNTLNEFLLRSDME